MSTILLRLPALAHGDLVPAGGNGLSDGKGYVQIYDPATNSWTWDDSLPNPRTGLGRAAYLGTVTAAADL